MLVSTIIKKLFQGTKIFSQNKTRLSIYQRDQEQKGDYKQLKRDYDTYLASLFRVHRNPKSRAHLVAWS